MEAADHAMFQASELVLYSEPVSNISLNDGEYEFQLHTLEKSAYTAVLRAFCAQSNALSWVHIRALYITQYYSILPCMIFQFSFG